MVVVGTGTQGTRFLKRNWPITSGLTAGTQKQEGRQQSLRAEESYVKKEDKKLL
jgi:hypothetical protein